MPNHGIVQAEYAAAEKRLAKLKNTAAYFRAFKTVLGKRSTYRLRQSSAPYYSIYNVGAYSFAPYKVIWAELSTTFEAVVVTTGRVPLAGERPFVPDHKVYFADFDDENTAYFVCAMLNSAMVKEYIESHTIQIQVSNIFKHMSIPRFKAADARHTKIVDLCKKAHLAKNDASRAEILDEMNKLSEEVLTGKKATKG